MRKQDGIHLTTDAGSSLISTLFIMMFLSFIFISVAGVVKHQIHQYRQTTYSYEAKTLIEMTEILIIEADSQDDSYPEKIDFTSGKVNITKIDVSHFLIEAVLDNQYTSRKEVVLAGSNGSDLEEDLLIESELIEAKHLTD